MMQKIVHFQGFHAFNATVSTHEGFLRHVKH